MPSRDFDEAGGLYFNVPDMTRKKTRIALESGARLNVRRTARLIALARRQLSVTGGHERIG